MLSPQHMYTVRYTGGGAINIRRQRKMTELLDKNEIDYYIPKRDSLIQVLGDCEACARVNAGRLRLPLVVRARGHRLGIHWEIDFT